MDTSSNNATTTINRVHSSSRKKISGSSSGGGNTIRWATIASSSSSSSPCSIISLLTHLMFGAICFQVGLIMGGISSNDNVSVLTSLSTPLHAKLSHLACPPPPIVGRHRGGPGSSRVDLTGSNGGPDGQDVLFGEDTNNDNNNHHRALFPPTMQSLFAGAAKVNRTDFAKLVELGVPLDPTKTGNEEVLILYSSDQALPEGKRRAAVSPAKYDIAQYDDAQMALQNCEAVKLVLLRPRRATHCVALMGQWESYHVHLFRRVPQEDPRIRNPDIAPRKDLPLRNVRRSINDDGTETRGLGLPSLRETKDNWKALVDYVTKLDTTLNRLRPVAKAAAMGRSGHGHAVVVMVVNWGQSALFANFVCAAKSRGIDLSHVLLFATDKSTYDLATSLGVHVFDVQDAFGDMPEQAAKFYGDPMFKQIMLSKVYCVHLILSLGYDVLFQDVDVVWRKNPVEFFTNTTNLGDYEMLFQDDGARSTRYSPYSPNTGFYYVKHTQRTMYLFNVFVRMGDLVIKYRSHQAALTALLNEHSSWKGLRVKVFGQDTTEGTLFPGGYHFHRRKDFMKDMLKGVADPYIFHMSWTESKDNKLLFLKQLGEWYLQPQCEEGKKVEELPPSNGNDLSSFCCSATPLVQCFYKDKPSKLNCRTSPSIDKGKPSFW